MKNLYIIEYQYEEREFDWYWAKTEKEAVKEWGKDMKENGWEEHAELVNLFEVKIPEDVVTEIQVEKGKSNKN